MCQQPMQCKANNEFYKKMFSNMATPMFVIDHNCVVTDINDAALNLLGYARGEVVNRIKCYELHRTLPLDTPEDCAVNCCMRQGEALDVEAEITARNGQEIPIHASHSPIFDEQGNFCGGGVTFFDRTQAENARRHLEKILQCIDIPMFVTDEDFLITRINDAALSMLGYKRDEIVGQTTCNEVFRTDICGTDECPLQAAMQTGNVVVSETSVRTRADNRIPVAVRGSPLFDEESALYGGLKMVYVLHEHNASGNTPQHERNNANSEREQMISGAKISTLPGNTSNVQEDSNQEGTTKKEDAQQENDKSDQATTNSALDDRELKKF